MTLKEAAGAVLITTVAIFLGVVVLVFASMQKSHAKSFTSSSSRSYSAPRSYSTPKTSYVTKQKTSTTKKIIKSVNKSLERDDDVECETLRNSRYAADREVYRRYC